MRGLREPLGGLVILGWVHRCVGSSYGVVVLTCLSCTKGSNAKRGGRPTLPVRMPTWAGVSTRIM